MDEPMDEPMPPTDAGDTLGPQPIPPPFVPMMSEDPLDGKSRLGGLSINPASGKRFVNEMLGALALPPNQAEAFVDFVLDQVPPGFLPKRQIQQIRQALLSERLPSPFAMEAGQLDAENFGNAITPNFTDFAYLGLSSKHLTSDSLHVYTRVPSENVGGVTFSLSGGEPVEGMPVPADGTISYTFRLDESLAATNLPAWPSLDTGLFSGVTLYHSNSREEGYVPVEMMQSTDGNNGVVWEAEVDVPVGGSTYYYFKVTLVDPVSFTTLDRKALADLDPNTITFEDIVDAITDPPYEISHWTMPDPRNLQLTNRGIIDELFDADVRAAIVNIYGSPQAASIRSKLLSGQKVEISEILGVITLRQQRTLQSLLLRNANRLVTRFETSYDPMLVSVFTVPRINPGMSLYFAPISDITDGNYELRAQVHRDGMVVDEIIEEFTVDTSAPEADIKIDEMNPGTNVTGYWNSENIFVATVPEPGSPGALNIKGMPKPAYTGQGVGKGEGYLFYQQIEFDAHGMPTSAWMPLSIESTMLTSRIWTALLEQNGNQIVQTLRQLAPNQVGNLDAESILSLAKATSPKVIVETMLTAGFIQSSANSFFKSLEPIIGPNTLSDAQAAAIHKALGASIEIVDHLVPVTFDAPHTVQMVILPGIHGYREYGIRAMGIDTLFNVGSYAEPTRLSVVMPEADKASVTAASIGDRNGDGDTDEPYESGTIFSNTTDGVMLTITVDHRSPHPADIWAEYMDANGNWQRIGEARMFAEGEDVSTFEVSWDVTDFDALVGAGEVMVRAVATNDLRLPPHISEPFVIKLDADVHPVDLEVLALVLDTESITKTNPDSGGPQGTVVVNAYTPQRTYPGIASLQLVIGDEVVGTGDTGVLATADEIAALQQNTDFITDLVAVAAQSTAAGGLSGKPISYPTYLKWAVEVDTTDKHCRCSRCRWND